jgi:hypothetical protein
VDIEARTAMVKCMNFKSLWLATILGSVAISASAPSWASLIADGITYSLFESTLDITGINGPTDTEGRRYGVNSIAFTEPTAASVVTASLAGFTFMTGGLNAMGCDGTGNFFCFKASTVPTAPALAANSELQLTFNVTVASAGDLANYSPDFKIQWLGGKSGKYDLVSQTLTPTPVPLPAALPQLLGGLAALRFMSRRKSLTSGSLRAMPAARSTDP